jgi:hypothetical protein
MESASKPPAGPSELERTWLHILWFVAAAWWFIGAVGAGLTLAFTYSVWSFAAFMPCAMFTVAALLQGAHIRKAGRRHDGR